MLPVVHLGPCVSDLAILGRQWAPHLGLPAPPPIPTVRLRVPLSPEVIQALIASSGRIDQPVLEVFIAPSGSRAPRNVRKLVVDSMVGDGAMGAEVCEVHLFGCVQHGVSATVDPPLDMDRPGSTLLVDVPADRYAVWCASEAPAYGLGLVGGFNWQTLAWFERVGDLQLAPVDALSVSGARR